MKNLLILLALSQLSACTAWQGISAREDVNPWERGILAKDNMKIPHDAVMKEIDEHIYFSKEAATGGFGVGGGGCGCN